MTEPLEIPETGRAAPAPPMTERQLTVLRRRTTAVLIAGQVLGGFGVAVGVALAALLAAEVSGSDALAGLALTASVLGAAALSVPLASLMARTGRRPGLVLGYLAGSAGGALVVAAAVAGSFPLLLVGMVVFGGASAANLQARFAAADLAPAAARGRAIAAVMWATTAGAVLGPNLAAPIGRGVAGFTGDRVPPTAGPFLWASVVFLAAAATVAILLRPDPLVTARALTRSAAETGEEREGGQQVAVAERPVRAALAAVSASPYARLALVTVALSHTVMVSIMVMTPLDLDHHGAGLELIGLVISGHITGMYAFSPVMGYLADRVGRLSVIGAALALLTCAAALAGTAQGHHIQAAAGLFLLGLGWSAGLVGGSALLTDSVPAEHRPGAQGLCDLTMNGCAAVGGGLAGVVVTVAGYGWLNLLGALLLLPLSLLALRTIRADPTPPG